MKRYSIVLPSYVSSNGLFSTEITQSAALAYGRLKIFFSIEFNVLITNFCTAFIRCKTPVYLCIGISTRSQIYVSDLLLLNRYRVQQQESQHVPFI